MDAKTSLEEIRSERFKDGGVYIDQFDEIIQECPTTSKNTIYWRFGRNRPIVLINGSNETVHCEPLPLSHRRSIVIGRVR